MWGFSMLIFIPNDKIDAAMRESMVTVANLAQKATCIDIIITVDGEQLHGKGNWIKYMQIGRPEPETLKERANQASNPIGSLSGIANEIIKQNIAAAQSNLPAFGSILGSNLTPGISPESGKDRV